MLTAACTVMLASWGEQRVESAGGYRRAKRARANRVVSCRSLRHRLQWVCMVAMAAVTARHAAISARARLAASRAR